MSLSGHTVERRVRLHEIPLLIGLIALWCMLWREVTLLSVVSGAIVAILVTRLFYLPPVELAGRFNLWHFAKYLVWFFTSVVVASFQVAWLAMRPRPVPSSSILAMQLHTRSDFLLTLTGLTASLIPGSLIVEVDRYNSVLYLHVFNTTGSEDVERARKQVERIERMLIRSIGSRDEVEMLNAGV